MGYVKACLLFLLVGMTFGFGQVSCNRRLSLFTRERLVIADAKDLRRTVVTAVLDWPITGNQNVIWCGSFQLAWNEVGSLLGEEVHLEPEPDLARKLNKGEFSQADVDEACYVALAGFVGEGIFEKIPSTLARKFEGEASPRFLPRHTIIHRPQDIVAYCYLFKNLEFPRPFEKLDREVRFDGKRLPCFGAGKYKSALIPIYAQVIIWDYQNEDDFVIELKTKAPKDRIILAKTAPQATLAGTVKAVQARLSASAATEPADELRLDRYPQRMYQGDILAIPNINFDFTRRYNELTGPRLVSKDPRVDFETILLEAMQNIRFQMDEKGVRLRSEVHLWFGCSSRPPEPYHIMIFDKPFLLMLQRTDSAMPYLAMWVGNGELWP